MSIKRATARGKVVWKARLGNYGKQITFPTKTEAQEWLDKQRENERRAKAGLPAEAGAITYDGLCELWLAGYTAETKEWTVNMLSHSRKEFGKLQVRAIRSEKIGAWLHGLSLSAKTKRHVLERMRCVLNAGIEWGYLGQSPARRGAVKAPPESRVTEIQPFESWAEVVAVAAAMDDGLDAAVVRFACATGLRPSEWQRLRWSDVDEPGKILFVAGTKTENAARTINLSRLALEALSALPRDTARVFPIVTYYYWRKDRWRKALAKAGLDQRPPGQMRHTYATLALSRGIPIDVVSKTMGHKDIQVTLKYYARHQRPSMQRWADVFDTLEEE